MALKNHQLDLGLSQEAEDKSGEARALSNISSTYEGMGELERAVQFCEQHLEAANQANDPEAKTKALGNLGKHDS